MAVENGTRRDVLRGLLVAAVTAALAPLVAASRPSRAEPPASGEPAESEAEFGTESETDLASGFDEMYRGRRIRGVKDASGVEETTSGVRRAGAAGPAPAGQWRVTVDDRPLHLMRRADGGYLTMIDHYQSYPTPLAAARGAVDELGGTLRLRAAAAEAGQGEGHGHGVHA
ncbi:tyrosinase family oxidase copper chaperone [Streptomyces sp. ActVer]|uniref:tyrosinase family oxidase copper chaperone n=1 Tax=Streptomyces sp. ActVer TaxID=3014558 RepID=UPI0022B58F3F|nr:tyrosinase family oxidase copper chaperone [Streptomyces sp. ActVer]MCZ4515681.1 tyrosinase family oxidase copper chaperone [Streptomyces sp. ActVer]